MKVDMRALHTAQRLDYISMRLSKFFVRHTTRALSCFGVVFKPCWHASRSHLLWPQPCLHSSWIKIFFAASTKTLRRPTKMATPVFSPEERALFSATDGVCFLPSRVPILTIPHLRSTIRALLLLPTSQKTTMPPRSSELSFKFTVSTVTLGTSSHMSVIL